MLNTFDYPLHRAVLIILYVDCHYRVGFILSYRCGISDHAMHTTGDPAQFEGAAQHEHTLYKFGYYHYHQP